MSAYRQFAVLLLTWVALSLGTWAALSTYSGRTFDYSIFNEECRASAGFVTSVDRGPLGPKNGECRGMFDNRVIGTQDGPELVRVETDRA